MRNYYYGNPKTLDLGKIRAEAVDVSKGDHRNKPQPVTIHFHASNVRCFNQQHEDYRDGEKVVSER